MTANQCIEYLNDYFITKLMTGDYEVKRIDGYTAEIEIGGKVFTFWVASGSANFRQYDSAYNFIRLEFDFEQKFKIFHDLNEVRRKRFAENRIKELEQEIERLKIP